MSAHSVQIGHLFTLLLMAVALGMDAFSLGIGMGMRGIRLLYILKVSLLIALFHFLMPLIGMFMGHYLGTLLGNVASMVGGTLLIILGIHMIYNSFKDNDIKVFDHTRFSGLLIFALSVSIDSMSVGFSLGLFSTDVLLAVLLFGTVGGIMSIMGLLLGRRVGSWIGEYGEALGGVILLAFGVRFLL